MEKIVFTKVEIIDPINKKYASESFIDGINLITSEETSRGKSSLIRALYHAMGANSVYDKKFKANEKIFTISFNSGDNHYKILRYKNTYVCYKNGVIIKKINSDYKELARFYENEFDISVYLTDTKNNFDIAPIAFSFIPYVLDQDKSWKSNDLPFNNMGQFLDYNRIDLYFYHLGILNKNFYESNKNKILTEKQITKINKKVSSILEEIKTLKEYNQVDNINFNSDDAKVSLENMKRDLSRSIESSRSLQNELFEIEEQIIKLSTQREEAQKILESIIKDKEEILKKSITCPSCNSKIILSEYDELRNSYTTEFLTESLKNINFDLDFLIKKRKEIRENYIVSEKIIEKIRDDYNSQNEFFDKYVRVNAISKLLESKEKDTVSMLDEINKLDDYLTSLDIELESYKIKKLQIGSEFKDKYLDNLIRLGVKNITKNDLETFKKIILSGNQDPRSTLSFYFAFLQLKRKYNPNNFLLPLIIDSPFEGDPDDYNKQDIVNDILAFYEFGEQLVVCLRNAETYFNMDDKPIKIIKLETEKDSLLSAIKFNENINYMYSIISIFDV